ncbi:hypothetical protein HPB47_025329 [Ixodes persulcatus]|uniref:Uncharacterized protein n=1 Tax=Ixodes persulcatus TaxID=34615 RepID=A0AC60Q3L7_IXOPE|nr:hypothetical protein HPB47_025329 [Ixodes persulcatus]
MAIVKSRTRKQFGWRSQFLKARGQNVRKKVVVAAAAAADVCSRASPDRLNLATTAAPAMSTPGTDLSCDTDTLTAFERKISLFKSGKCGGSTEDAEDQEEPSGDNVTGYRLVDVACVRGLVEALVCPTCHAVIISAPLSSTIDGTQQTELTARLGFISRNCGLGFTKLTHFFTGLNALPPMHLKSYQKIAAKVHDVAMRASCNVMSEAAQIVRKTLGSRSAGNQALQDVSLETGLALDYTAVSHYCHGCSLDPKEGAEGHRKWQEDHESSSAMEVRAADIIFARSVELHNLQYTTILCDGDSKAFKHIAAQQLYDKEVSKEDCVNHKVKKANKGLVGRSKLTNVVVKRMTNYYASTLKQNAPDVTAMQCGVFASLLCMYSTDEEPRHNACPKGEESWCHHNRHLALQVAGKPSAPKPHRPAFSREVVKELKRCPKTEFASLKTVETSVALAALEFNLGPKGMERALLEMKIEAGSHHESQTRKATQHRLSRSRASALDSSKAPHKRRRLEAVASEQKCLQEEGPTYAVGLFQWPN